MNTEPSRFYFSNGKVQVAISLDLEDVEFVANELPITDGATREWHDLMMEMMRRQAQHDEDLADDGC